VVCNFLYSKSQFFISSVAFPFTRRVGDWQFYRDASPPALNSSVAWAIDQDRVVHNPSFQSAINLILLIFVKGF